MAYKQKGCTPITAKIQKGTKGGITNPLLNVGVPMKTPLKVDGVHSRDKKMAERRGAIKDAAKYIGGKVSQAAGSGMLGVGAYVASKGVNAILGSGSEKKKAATPTGGFSKNGAGAATVKNKKKDSNISMTPYSKEKALYTKSGSKGKINGPKVSYDMAYEKAKKTKRYANMSKADYIKEAKRQTKSFKESGNWNANPKKPKAKAVSTIKSEPVKTIAPKVSVESKLTKAPSYDTSRITSKSKVVTPKKNRKDTRQENKVNRKATRQENRTIRKNKRVERRSKR